MKIPLQYSNHGSCLRCEHCKPGFYGSATIGTENDCKRCACPLTALSNNFSPSCKPKEGHFRNSSHDEFICTNCAEGHIGDNCEACDDGYYGLPTIPGSKCFSCDCNGDPCDRVTGKCIKCEGNTEGWRCDRCKVGYFGDPSVGCEMCECDDSGAINNLCDAVTGKCNCKNNYRGDQCEECEVKYKNKLNFELALIIFLIYRPALPISP